MTRKPSDRTPLTTQSHLPRACPVCRRHRVQMQRTVCPLLIADMSGHCVSISDVNPISLLMIHRRISTGRSALPHTPLPACVNTDINTLSSHFQRTRPSHPSHPSPSTSVLPCSTPLQLQHSHPNLHPLQNRHHLRQTTRQLLAPTGPP